MGRSFSWLFRRLGARPLLHASADLTYGWDLSSRSGVATWRRCVEDRRPKCVLNGPSYTEWCWYNATINCVGCEDELLARRNKAMGMINLAIWTAKRQAQAGRWFVIENPVSSKLFATPEFQAVWAIPSVSTGVRHGCRHSLMGADGVPLLKPMRFVTNMPFFVETCCLTCARDHPHEVAEGRITHPSQE